MKGVAPTDDYFTVIMDGPENIDKDGPTLISDPDLGFCGLRQFGNVLLNKTQLKIRKNIFSSKFLIVDSPGMYDCMQPSSGHERFDGSRGYDIYAVFRWYVERADVILLFFDPEKPGTTGETLSILRNVTHGYEHKLSIILNKADTFISLNDFARTYGSLCWNLAKAIPRKDLPTIHVTSLPFNLLGHRMDNESSEQSRTISPLLKDLLDFSRQCSCGIFL